MNLPKSTLWDNLLQPFFQTFLLDNEEIETVSRDVDWQAGEARFCPVAPYPDYYQGQNFHGITGGYLTVTAALTYDPITRYVLPPQENWVRGACCDRIGGEPRRILDFGCGTGSTTLLLKEKYPRAKVVGLDLSPQMLTMAAYKGQKAGLAIEWCQGLAEQTSFSTASFDLITASLLFHETPARITRSILREAFRLLVPGGQLLILDGNQNSLRQNEWLTQVFEEPYIQEFAQGDLSRWLKQSQFEGIETEDLWWFHQLTQAYKPLAVSSRIKLTFESDGIDRSAAIPIF